MQLHSWVRYGNVESVRERLQHLSPDKIKADGATLLGIAARSRFAGVDILQLLVEHGANPNGVVSDLDGTPLSIAAKSGNVDKVRYLLAAGADPHFRTSQGYTPLINGTYSQAATRSQVVHLLLAAGADPNVVTSYGESAVGTALYFSDFETLHILLDAGANGERIGWNAFLQAIVFGSVDDVQAELLRGADPNDNLQPAMGITPWRMCLLVGDVARAEKLVEQGAAVSSEDLFAAVKKDNPEMVRWLLGHGADANIQDGYQHSVLSKAATWGANACVKLLIEAGANVHAEDHVQSQPISDAATPEIARLLVEAGADINFVSGQGYTLLKYAAESIKVEMVRALLEMGADTDAETKRYSTTPLYVAVQQDDLEIARLLLEAGANPNAQNADHWFPLSNAQSIEMVQLLLDYGADIHLIDERGMDALQSQDDPEVAAYLIDAGAQVNPDKGQSGSPLREAARKGNLEMMRLLLQRGANVDQAMSWGATALMQAAEISFVEGVRLLLEHQANVHLKEEEEHGRTALFYAAAPEGFSAYKLMKRDSERNWLDSVPEEHRDLIGKINIDLSQFRSTYGYIASDSVEALELLLEAGADINARDKQEMTPLILTASCGRPARVAALLRAGADIHLRDTQGMTALDHARLHPEADHRAAIVQMLEEAERR
ncbi:MAG: ankyrin repeat domain-containing protein [Anaerolineae bacterium]